MTKERLVPQWTRVHAFRLRLEDACEQCGEPITYGTYKREVWISRHPRFGDLFIIRRYHDDPICQKYWEWER